MADHSTIEWTEATWNPITGCSVVSPGCTNCYAMKLAGTRLKNIPSRTGLTRDAKGGPVWTGEVRLNEQWLDQPLRWKRPRKIFVCAHGDLFAEGVPDEWIDRVFAIMALAPQHTFQVLTKRSARMRQYLSAPQRDHRLVATMASFSLAVPEPFHWPHLPLPNVWLGVSAEDQARADERITDLLDTPAAIRFASAEPLLGPIRFDNLDGPSGTVLNSLNGKLLDEEGLVNRGAGLDWIIVGGESGPDARPMHPDWARSIRDQCAAAGVAFFFKQWGSWAPICAMKEEQIDRCYRSNRKAKEFENQGTVDELWGRTCIVENTVLHADGTRHDHLSRTAFSAVSAMTMFNIGKKAAGRLLDGREHSEFPEAR